MKKRFEACFAAVVVMGMTGGLTAKPYNDTTSWDPFVAEIGDADTYLRRKFRQDVTDKSTGLDNEKLKKLLGDIVAADSKADEKWCVTKAKCFAAQAEHMAIDVSPFDWFPAIAVWNRWDRPISGVIYARQEEVNGRTMSADVIERWRAGNAEGRWTLWRDYDHSVPDWREIIPLGFPGMARRVEEFATRGEAFDRSLAITAAAMLAGIDRFIAQGERRMRAEAGARSARLEKEVASLKRLRHGAPETAYDLMMFIWLYFFYEEHLDGFQCRSLTELDVFLAPYYERDLAAGRTSEVEFREQLKHFLWQWGSIANYWNHPIGLGGTKRDGTSEYGSVSRCLLEVMDECALPSPKFLVKVGDSTPDWAWNKMMDLARRHRSIAFLGEKSMARGMRLMCPSATDDDCRELVMWGCYEYALRDGANTTLSFSPSVLKPVEETLSSVDAGKIADYDGFLAAYFARLGATIAEGLAINDQIESSLAEVNPAGVMTVATGHAIRSRRDAFANGCRRGNDSVVRFCGFGTAVDALLAVKEIVYEKRELTLAELARTMSENWKDHEELRRRMLRSRRKWGNNDPEANAIGARLARFCSEAVAGKPNVRGGHYFASGHTSRRYIDQAAHIGATPDGRLKGEEMSKNLSPTMGVDREGATALVETLRNATVNEFPGDAPLDLMLHPSSCAGDKGLAVMRTLVSRCLSNGGTVVQFTVFSPEELREAQRHPDKYENLQVRVCGWNVRWNDLSREEQDAYIRRSENIR